MLINVEFVESESVIDVIFQEENEEIDVEFDELLIIHSGDIYTGEYEIIPLFEEQILETKDKIMAHDLHILEIPMHTTTNPSGGYTLFIGGLEDAEIL